MGINSGPVEEVTDVNGRRNVTGAGINLGSARDGLRRCGSYPAGETRRRRPGPV
jgi:hypothetical protein